MSVAATARFKLVVRSWGLDFGVERGKVRTESLRVWLVHR